MEDGDGILVIGPSWVGDMVMAQTLFKILKSRYPGSEIDVLAPAWSEPLLARMPEVNRALTLPAGHGELKLGLRYRLGRALRKEGYGQAIVLPNSLKSALLPFFAGIPRRTGWRGEMRYGLLNDIRTLDKTRYPLMVERFAALACDRDEQLPPALPWPRLETSAEGRDTALRKHGLSTDRPVLALCPGAEFGPSKRWPEGHYRAVAEAKIADGWQVWVFGSANDKAVADAICHGLPRAGAGHCRVLAGETTLAEAIDLMALAACVVSNDSGLMHIAAALDRPLVAVYGSTSPAFTPPLGERVATLSIPVECGPCFQRECPLGHLKCLVGVEPRRVLDAIVALAGGGAGGRAR